MSIFTCTWVQYKYMDCQSSFQCIIPPYTIAMFFIRVSFLLWEMLLGLAYGTMLNKSPFYCQGNLSSLSLSLSLSLSFSLSSFLYAQTLMYRNCTHTHIRGVHHLAVRWKDMVHCLLDLWGQHVLCNWEKSVENVNVTKNQIFFFLNVCLYLGEMFTETQCL